MSADVKSTVSEEKSAPAQNEPIGAIFVSLIGLGLFTYLIQQPTALGRKILDHLEGFKMYMEYADKERIRLNNPPTMDFEHWEANLPYAIALGVAKEWSNQFDPKELERGFSTGHIWYGAMMAHGIHSFDMSSMSSSISSAATPSSEINCTILVLMNSS